LSDYESGSLDREVMEPSCVQQFIDNYPFSWAERALRRG